MLTKELLKKRSVWRYVFVMIIQLENDMGKKLMTFLKTNELIFFLKDWRKNVRSGSLTKGELQIKIDFKTCATLISFYLLKQEPLKKTFFQRFFPTFYPSIMYTTQLLCFMFIWLFEIITSVGKVHVELQKTDFLIELLKKFKNQEQALNHVHCMK